MAIVLCTAAARGAVKPVSPDGEATIYLNGAFSSNFDLAYRAVLKPGSSNRSWTSLSILLVGRKIPGPGVSVGLISDPPRRGVVSAFTYTIYGDLKDDYRSHSVSCRNECVLELRGDAFSIYAYLDGKRLATWSRSDLYLLRPSIQLNAEAHGLGDSLVASLTPLRSTAARQELRHPTCAFTTRGIEPRGNTVLTFHGTTNDAQATFLNLSTNTSHAKC